MAAKTEIEKNLKNEDNQKEIDRKTAEMLLAGKKAHEEGKKK